MRVDRGMVDRHWPGWMERPSSFWRRSFIAWILLALWAPQLPAAEDLFVQEVLPILRERCFTCHAQGTTEGGLDLSDRERAMAGGEHGPVIVPQRSDASALIQRVSSTDESQVMPPEGSPLTPDQIAVLRRWIDAGAKWSESADPAATHWAFQPLHVHPLPSVKHDAWPRTAIDRFILKELETQAIEPAERASAERLIRRLTLDLTGLPPTPTEIEAFHAAYTRDADRALCDLVDRLLGSSHYGERWARHWLDVARYADSDGQESDRDRDWAFPYRDFVIRAFNDDMPYDQFVRWQLAGDEYAPQNPLAIAATGFLIAGPFAALPDRLMEDERLRNRFNELDDMLSTIGSGLLGMTLGCARCHDHKYDPIPARDYYQMLSALQSGDRAERSLGNSEDKVLAYFEPDAEPEPAWLFRRGNYYDREIPVQLGFLSALTRDRSADDYLSQARKSSEAGATTNQRRAMADWMTDVERGAGALLARVFVNRLWMHHFGRGLVSTPGDFGTRAGQPSHPELLEWLALDFVTHGWQVKRLQRMIVLSSVYLQDSTSAAQERDPENRWLGRMSLRRLEGEAVRDAMLAVSGTLNRQAYGPAVKIPIAAEAIVARNLKSEYPSDIKDSSAVRRRAVYLFHKRVVPDPLQQAFDKPDAQQTCSRRDRTTVAPQALALLNDRWVRTVAYDFARRVMRETANDEEAATLALQLALGRRVDPAERAAAVEMVRNQMVRRQQRDANLSGEEVRQQAIADFCQVVFSLNEFIYID